MFGRRTRRTHVTPVTTTRTTRRRGGLFGGRRAKRHTVRPKGMAALGTHPHPGANTHHPHTTAAAPVVHHHKRRPSIGDKISGALLKLKGTLTGRPGEKAAGTRRMHGTDGRGSRRVTTTRRRRFF